MAVTNCVNFICSVSQSQWPRGLRRGSAAARSLVLWVQIPPKAWKFVSCERCVFSGNGLCFGLNIWPEESFSLFVLFSVIVKLQKWGGPGPRWAVAPFKIIRTLRTEQWFRNFFSNLLLRPANQSIIKVVYVGEKVLYAHYLGPVPNRRHEQRIGCLKTGRMCIILNGRFSN